LSVAVWRPGVYVSDPEGSGQHILTADDIRGVPVPEAFDALVRIYETLAERALAEGGDDPFLEAARRDHAHRSPDGHETTFEHWLVGPLPYERSQRRTGGARPRRRRRAFPGVGTTGAGEGGSPSIPGQAQRSSLRRVATGPRSTLACRP